MGKAICLFKKDCLFWAILAILYNFDELMTS